MWLLVLGACGAGSSAPDAGVVDGAVGDAPADTSSMADAPLVDAALPLLAPTLFMAQTTSSGVSLGWVNNTMTCDSVQGERKYGLVDYTVVFEVSGTTTMFLDTTSLQVGQSTQCTYRVRCKRGADLSTYSSEIAAFCAPSP